MSEKTMQSLNDVAETLLIPLYVRALESQRPDALIHDEKAMTLVADHDFSWIDKLKLDDGDKLALVLRNREFDRQVRDFLARCPEAVVVHMGCGFDTRFERVDNGTVEWYDLDLPDVIDLRKKYIGGEGPRYHFLPYSAFDPAWIDCVSGSRSRPFLFLTEGVLMYFDAAQVKGLVLLLRDHFPGAEFVCDGFPPFLMWANNFRVARTKIGARYHFGMKNPQVIEGWGDGIRLLDHWYIFDRPEPRLDRMRWMRFVPLFRKVMGVFHYRLGEG